MHTIALIIRETSCAGEAAGGRTCGGGVPQAASAAVQQLPQLVQRCFARGGTCGRRCQGGSLIRWSAAGPGQVAKPALERGVKLHEECQRGSGGAAGARGHRVCQRGRQIRLHRKDLPGGAAGGGAAGEQAQGRPGVSGKASVWHWPCKAETSGPAVRCTISSLPAQPT